MTNRDNPADTADAGDYVAPDEKDPMVRIAELETMLSRVLTYLDPAGTSHILHPEVYGAQPEKAL